MTIRTHILATAGHVDHGKSSLVRALTGTNPDRLPEEKARQLTIELGFAYLQLPLACGATCRLGVVDVPGHEDFVKNMVAGVGAVDVALLAVAADDGWMPQSEEHLQILTYLGVRHGVVALTRSDRVRDVSSIMCSVRERLRGSPLAAAPIIPTSVVAGVGLDPLRAALAEVLSKLPATPDVGKPRLPIDRVFQVKGVGTIVTGTLTGGALHRGQRVFVQPGAQVAHIRSLQAHNDEVESAQPGMRVALNLPELKPARRDARRARATAARGDVVTTLTPARPSQTLDVMLWRADRACESFASRPLRQGVTVHVHHGSAAVSARLRLIDAEQLGPGERALAQLRLAHPMFAFAGDRLVLRDAAQQQTLAGGLVLDPAADRRRCRQPQRVARLRCCADTPADPTAWVRHAMFRQPIHHGDELLRQSIFGPTHLKPSLAVMIRSGEVVVVPPWLIDGAFWRQLRQAAVDAVEREHRQHPERSGLDVRVLRNQLCERGATAPVVPTVVDDLCKNGFMQVGTIIRSRRHIPVLPPRFRAAGDQLREALNAEPLTPPNPRQLAPDAVTQQALRFLVLNGDAIEIASDVVLSAAAYEQAVRAVREHLSEHGSATVAQLKRALGSTRRIMVPLLEHFDAKGITWRQGDRRFLRERALYC